MELPQPNTNDPIGLMMYTVCGIMGAAVVVYLLTELCGARYQRKEDNAVYGAEERVLQNKQESSPLENQVNTPDNRALREEMLEELARLKKMME